MDLDEMKQLWSTLDTRVAHLEHVRAHDRTRSALRGVIAAEAVKLVAWALFVAFAVPVLGDVPIAAGSIVFYALAGGVLGALQLRAALAIDLAAPIVVLQRELLALERLRAWCSLALGLPWWLLWIAFPITLAAHAGIDLAAHLRLVIAANLLVGLVGLIAHVVIARLLVRRAPRSPRIQRMLARLAATRLRHVAAELGELARFRES